MQFYPGQKTQFESIQPFRGPWHKASMIDILTRQGLTSNLKLCLDAGNGASAPSSTTTWLDTSGNGYDFFRGTTSSGEASDPTFNGSVDGRTSSEYWSFDGGDYFTYDSTNETWMQNLHKDNAIFTVIGSVYRPAGVAASIFGTNGGVTANTGCHIITSATGGFLLRVANSGSTVLNTTPGGGSLNDDAWSLFAVAVNEGTADGRIRINNNSTNTFDPTYSSPSSGNATYTMQIGARGNGNAANGSGVRFGTLGMWEGTALTNAQIDSVFTALRARFGV